MLNIDMLYLMYTNKHNSYKNQDDQTYSVLKDQSDLQERLEHW